MKRATEIIKSVARETESAILFHSASGKDSIALLDLMSPHFKEIVCVYMYVVKDLSHINRYISYATAKYKNARFIQVPHFSLSTFVRTGYMGCDCNPSQRKFNMVKIADTVRRNTGIEWSFYGFKQSDGLARRIMLRGKDYEQEAIFRKTKKCYPLSSYKNGDVIEYIRSRNLIQPEQYYKLKHSQSSGTNITDLGYLLWVRDNFPTDLAKITRQFPGVEHILYEYDYKAAQDERKETVTE